MIAYPAGLPKPERDGFGYEPVNPLLRSNLASGRARQRRLYTSVPTMVNVSWVFNDQEAQLFEAWWEDILVGGSQWFDCPLLTPESVGMVRAYEGRFTGIYSGPQLIGISLWRYTAELEIRERPILAPGLGILPDFILNPEIFDLAMNMEWPEA